MVSKDCIYLKSDDSQIWLDYGTRGQLRDFYLYENNELILQSHFTFFKGHLCVSGKGLISWPYEKNDEYSIKINGKVFGINKDDTKQLELFDELLEHIF